MTDDWCHIAGNRPQRAGVRVGCAAVAIVLGGIGTPGPGILGPGFPGAETTGWGLRTVAAGPLVGAPPENQGTPAAPRADDDRAGEADDEADAALLSELQQLEDEWRTEQDFDETQMFPPGQGSAADLEGNEKKEYANLVSQLFRAGTGPVSAGAKADELEARCREMLRQAERLGADDPRLPWLASLVLSRLDRHEGALTLLARAAELSPQQQSTVLLQQASLQVELGDSAAALKTCQTVVNQWPTEDTLWPGPVARETQASWLGQIGGFVAGGEDVPASRLEELRRIIARRWAGSLVASYEREFERVRKSRQESRRKQASTWEQQQAEARQEIEDLRRAIERSRDSEKQLRLKLDNLKSPHEEQLDSLMESLKQKSQKLNAIQSRARRLAGRLQQTAQKKTTAGKGNSGGKGNSRGKGGSRGKGNSARKRVANQKDSQREQVQQELKKTLDELRDVQKEVADGRTRRKELEASHAKAILPVKQEWNRVRLARQSQEKDLELAQEVLARPAGSPPVPDRFHQWRTVLELDLLHDLQSHWQE